MDRKYATISETAKALGVSEQALRAWHKAGVIRVVRTPGGHRRFNIEEVRWQLFMEERQKCPLAK